MFTCFKPGRLPWNCLWRKEHIQSCDALASIFHCAFFFFYVFVLGLEINQEYGDTLVASVKNMLISPMTAISDLWSHWLSPLTNSSFIPPTENTPGSGYLPPLKSREPFSTWWGSHWSLRFVLPSELHISRAWGWWKWRQFHARRQQILTVVTQDFSNISVSQIILYFW